MKALLIYVVAVAVLLGVGFIGYEYYLSKNPDKYVEAVDPTGYKMPLCGEKYKCRFGSHCILTSAGENLPGFLEKCKLYLNFSK